MIPELVHLWRESQHWQWLLGKWDQKQLLYCVFPDTDFSSPRCSYITMASAASGCWGESTSISCDFTPPPATSMVSLPYTNQSWKELRLRRICALPLSNDCSCWGGGSAHRAPPGHHGRMRISLPRHDLLGEERSQSLKGEGPRAFSSMGFYWVQFAQGYR